MKLVLRGPNFWLGLVLFSKLSLVLADADPAKAVSLAPTVVNTIVAHPPGDSVIVGGEISGGGRHGAGYSPNNDPKQTSTDPEHSKNPCTDTYHVADPIVPSTGNKVEQISDFALSGEMGLHFTRYYISRNVHGSTATGGWTDNLDYELHNRCIASAPSSCSSVTFMRPDGSQLSFSQPGTVKSGALLVGPFTEIGGGGHASLSYFNSGDGLPGTYTLVDEDALVYTFSDTNGLTSIKNPAGIGWTLVRSLDKLTTTVRHTSGRSMKLVSSTDGNVSVLTVTDPAGNNYVYRSVAGSTASFNVLPLRLASVLLPGTPSTTISYQYAAIAGSDPALSEVDYNGVPHDYTYYDASGRASESRMADGSQRTTIVYGSNATGPIATITNPLGKVAVFQYNAAAQLLSITGQAAPSCAASYAATTYDGNGNIQTATDNRGTITRYTYAATGQLTQLVEASGTSSERTTNYVWDSTPGTNRVLSETIVGLRRTSYTYDARSRPTAVTVTNLSANGVAQQSLSVLYSYTLYANGMVQTLSMTRPSPNNSDTDVYNYDSLGNLTSQANGLGQTVSYSNYNGLGQVGHVVGANGETSDYSYDARGRLAAKTRYPYGIAASTTYTYDGFGLPYTLTTTENDAFTWNRNAAMLVTSVVHNDKDGSSTESYGYDVNADITSHTVVRAGDVGLSESASYDALGRRHQTLGSHGQALTYDYDVNNQVISTTDALGHVTGYAYDALNRVVRVTDPNDGSTQYSYGLDDQPTSVTDPRGLVTRYVYDGFGRLLQQTSPDTGITSYQYDSYGRRANMTRTDGTVTSYGYDGIGRKTSISAGGQTQTFGYDNCSHGIGHLCSAADATGTTAYAYTPEGWISGRSFSMGGTTYALGYNYDGQGRLTVVSYPDGINAVYYRTNGAVNSVLLVINGAYTWVASSIGYRPGDLAMSSWLSSNGISNTASYDSDMRLSGITASGVQSLGFGYDAANRLTQINNGIDASMTQSFGYDGLSRLTSVSGTAQNESYQYDADGNRTYAVVNGIGQNYSYASNSNQ